MEIREIREGDVLVLAPDGGVAGSEETNALETKLATTLKTGFRQVVVDCSTVGQLTSAAVRVLLMTSRRLDRTGGRLVLCAMRAKLKKAFSISGFDKDFSVAATREEALQRVLEPVPPQTPKPPRTTKAAAPKGGTRKGAVQAPPQPDVPAAVPETPVVQTPAAAPVPIDPTPPAPDFRDALTTILLKALGGRVLRPDGARPGNTAPPNLDALASGILAALRPNAS
jgi:anti-anti-sigma factor